MKDVIVCSKFVLRKLKPIEDKESIFENINDKEVLKNLYINFPFTEEDYKKMISIFETEKTENSSFKYIIEVDKKAVGFVGAHWSLKDCSKHIADFNYWLGKKYWGQGIMTEAIKIMCDIAFNEFGKLKLVISALEDNIGSRKVAEKMDLNLIGSLKKKYLKMENIKI